MARLSCGVVVVILVIVAAGCKGGGPTTQTGTPRPLTGEPFEVTGVVTDDQGVPLAGADVTMAHSLGGMFRRPSVQTDASGHYTIVPRIHGNGHER